MTRRPIDAELDARVRGLLAQSRALEWGSTQVVLAEEAVRLADAHGDMVLGFEARQWLIEAATFSGLKDRAIAPFTWCLAQFDRDPQRFPNQRLLWQYKWIVGAAEDSPWISLDETHALLGDMERRYQQNSLSLRSVFKHRLGLAILMGNEQEARNLYQDWLSAPRDQAADCLACERHHEILYWRFLGEDERALEAARPILDGRMRCHVVPRLSLAQLLLPLVRLGRIAEAMECHRKGHRLTVRNPKWTWDAAAHIVFLVLTDHLTKALRLLESHLPFPHDPIAADRSDHFDFFLAARFLMERLRASGRKTIRLRLHESFPARQEEGKYDVSALESWFELEARRIGARYDARHQTDRFARDIAANLALKDRVSPFPLGRSHPDRPPPREGPEDPSSR